MQQLRKPPLSRELSRRLARAGHAVFEMAHGVGDAPKIPFPQERANLSRLHYLITEEKPPKTAKEADYAATVLERALDKWKSYENLRRAHAREFSSGNFAAAGKLKKSLDALHARLAGENNLETASGASGLDGRTALRENLVKKPGEHKGVLKFPLLLSNNDEWEAAGSRNADELERQFKPLFQKRGLERRSLDRHKRHSAEGWELERPLAAEMDKFLIRNFSAEYDFTPNEHVEFQRVLARRTPLSEKELRKIAANGNLVFALERTVHGLNHLFNGTFYHANDRLNHIGKLSILPMRERLYEHIGAIYNWRNANKK